MQHEAFEGFLFEKKIHALLVFLGAERDGRQSLSLTASEKRRTVYARQQTRLASNLANLIERASIGTPSAHQHILAEILFAEALEGAHGQLHLVFVVFGNGRLDFFLDGIDARVAFELGILRGVESIV